MTLLQFFTTSVISAIVLLFIRVFWKQIVFIGTVLNILGHLIFWSFLVAVLWAAFISQTDQGWLLLWLYFFLLFSGIILIYALIVIDAFDIAIDWIKLFIKKLTNQIN